jgi:hypothetical protein
MRKQNFNALLLFAKSQKDRFAVSKAIWDSHFLDIKPNEKGALEPVIGLDLTAVREKLVGLGCSFAKNPRRQFEHVVQVDVMHGEDLIASGTSHDEDDALLAALLGFVRERNIAALQEQGMSKEEAQKASVGTSTVLNT